MIPSILSTWAGLSSWRKTMCVLSADPSTWISFPMRYTPVTISILIVSSFPTSSLPPKNQKLHGEGIGGTMRSHTSNRQSFSTRSSCTPTPSSCSNVRSLSPTYHDYVMYFLLRCSQYRQWAVKAACRSCCYSWWRPDNGVWYLTHCELLNSLSALTADLNLWTVSCSATG